MLSQISLLRCLSCRFYSFRVMAVCLWCIFSQGGMAQVDDNIDPYWSKDSESDESEEIKSKFEKGYWHGGNYSELHRLKTTRPWWMPKLKASFRMCNMSWVLIKPFLKKRSICILTTRAILKEKRSGSKHM